MIEIKPIRSPEDYEVALSSIEELWGAPSGTPQGDQLDILATLVDAYERENFPMDEPSAEAIAAFDKERRRLSGHAPEPILKFQIFKNITGHFVFRLLLDSEILFTSEMFETKTEAMSAIELLRNAATHSEIVDIAA